MSCNITTNWNDNYFHFYDINTQYSGHKFSTAAKLNLLNTAMKRAKSENVYLTISDNTNWINMRISYHYTTQLYILPLQQLECGNGPFDNMRNVCISVVWVANTNDIMPARVCALLTWLILDAPCWSSNTLFISVDVCVLLANLNVY